MAYCLLSACSELPLVHAALSALFRCCTIIPAPPQLETSLTSSSSNDDRGMQALQATAQALQRQGSGGRPSNSVSHSIPCFYYICYRPLCMCPMVSMNVYLSTHPAFCAHAEQPHALACCGMLTWPWTQSSTLSCKSSSLIAFCHAHTTIVTRRDGLPSHAQNLHLTSLSG